MTQPDPSVSSESVSDLSPHPLSFPTSQALVEPEDQTEASKSKGSKAWRENRALFLGVGATAVVLGGSLAAYVSQRHSGPSPQAAIGLVPQSAIAAVQLSGDRSQWASLRQIGTPSLQMGLGQWLAIGRDRIVNLGYGDWQTLQSQIDGESAIALIPTEPLPGAAPPVPGTRPNGTPPDLLVVVPVKNPGAIERKIASLEPPKGFENSKSAHRGVEIFEIQANLSQRHHIALVGSFWVMAANRSSVTQAIDSFYDRTSLQLQPDFQAAQRQLAQDDTGFLDLYINTPAATQAAAAAGRLLPLPVDIQGLTAQFDLMDNGFAIKSLTWQAPRSAGLGVLAAAPEPVEPVNLTQAFGDRFPASTSLLLSGSSLKDAWASHAQSSNASPLYGAAALQEQIQVTTSMDLNQDWLAWMDGAYSVGMLPISSQANSRFQTGLTVMVQTSNRRLAERSLQKLDSLMVNKYRMRLNAGKLAEQPVVNWFSEQGEPVVTHGWLEGNVAFLIVGAPGANSLLPQPRATLATSPLYKEGMPRREQELPTGQLFVDVDRVSKTNLTSLLPLPTGTKPFLDALKSVGAERRVLDARLTRYDLSFQFLRSFAPPVVSTPESPEASVSPAPTVPTPTVPTPTAPAPTAPAPTAPAPTAPSAQTPKAPSTPQTEPSPDLSAPVSGHEKLGHEKLGHEKLGHEKLGPFLPKDPYDRDVFGPKPPRPNENPWSDGFVESPGAPITPAESQSSPEGGPSRNADTAEQPGIPLGPEFPEPGDRQPYGPSRPQ